jgi:outer membrane protein assembly factor BamB
MKTTILSIILIAILPGFIEAQKISEWRPENRTGVSAETGLMKSWPAAGPTLLWSNLDLARGYSSPSFGTNTIYITGNIDTNEILFALNMNGKILWQTVMCRAWTGSTTESRTTPTVEGNRVYTCSGFGDLACINGTTGPFWVHPVIHNGVLYLRHTNALMAYNIKAK